MTMLYKPYERPAEEVEAQQRQKEGYCGSAQSPPREAPVDIFKLGGRSQKAWPNFTYVPPPPVIDMRTWRFETYGLIENPLSLDYEEFKRLPTVSSREDAICIDYVNTPDHSFEGVALETILEMTKPHPDCQWVLLEAYGGHTMSQSIMLPTRLVYKKDGEPLDPGHGYPLRAWTPGEFGYKNLKWIHRVKFCEEREMDYYMAWYILNGIDPDALTEGYDASVATGLPFEVINDFNTNTYFLLTLERRRNLHLLGGRQACMGQYKAPIILHDDTWNAENYEYFVGQNR